MNEIQIFKNENFGEVRVTEVNGEPMFCLADVAKALEYANPAKAVIDHCKGVTILETPTNGGVQQMKYGKESEVYRLIMKSKAKRAEAFQDWVCEEVLPTIRKTGSYSIPSDYLSALKALVASEEEKQRLALENTTMKPKAEYYDTLVDRNSLTNIRDTSKAIGVKEKLFVTYLIGNGYLYRDNKKQLKPIAKYTGDDNLFVMKEFVNGSRTGMQTLITVKGKEYFTNKFNKAK